jgi:lipoate-protein ligase A
MKLSNINEFDLIPYTVNHAKTNMALDEVMYNSVKNNTRQAVFRIYGWTIPAITIGYFQQQHNINLNRCIKNNIPVIRRITGGRAVLHKDEITYSISMKVKDHIVSKKDVFYELSHIIINGLKTMGINATINSKTKGSYKNPNCFQTTSIYEIINEHNKKIVGSALLTQRNNILMQGSIPLTEHYKDINQYINQLPITNINTIKINQSLINKKVNSFLKGVSKTIKLKPSKLTNIENEELTSLIKNKYSKDSWNKSKKYI